MKVEGFDSSIKHRAICTQTLGVFMFSLRLWQKNYQHFPNTTIT